MLFELRDGVTTVGQQGNSCEADGFDAYTDRSKEYRNTEIGKQATLLNKWAQPDM